MFFVIGRVKIIRAIFNLVLKVIRDCIGFALMCSVIGLENSRHLLSQSDTKLKPIATWLGVDHLIFDEGVAGFLDC